MSKLFIWVGERMGCRPEVYGCDYYVDVPIIEYLEPLLYKSKNAFDGFVIHFDNLYMNILEDFVAKGRNTEKYQLRIHSVDAEQAVLFYSFIDKNWTSQEGWFIPHKGGLNEYV